MSKMKFINDRDLIVGESYFDVHRDGKIEMKLEKKTDTMLFFSGENSIYTKNSYGYFHFFITGQTWYQKGGNDE